ncbi:hypothetical protein H311_02361 [Anncaliia algerae PRA109]|nr:hypothetical protein H311_02361 [Anncaliia algerae PRA109]
MFTKCMDIVILLITSKQCISSDFETLNFISNQDYGRTPNIYIKKDINLNCSRIVEASETDDAIENFLIVHLEYEDLGDKITNQNDELENMLCNWKLDGCFTLLSNNYVDLDRYDMQEYIISDNLYLKTDINEQNQTLNKQINMEISKNQVSISAKNLSHHKNWQIKEELKLYPYKFKKIEHIECMNLGYLKNNFSLFLKIKSDYTFPYFLLLNTLFNRFFKLKDGFFLTSMRKKYLLQLKEILKSPIRCKKLYLSDYLNTEDSYVLLLKEFYVYKNVFTNIFKIKNITCIYKKYNFCEIFDTKVFNESSDSINKKLFKLIGNCLHSENFKILFNIFPELHLILKIIYLKCSESNVISVLLLMQYVIYKFEYLRELLFGSNNISEINAEDLYQNSHFNESVSIISLLLTEIVKKTDCKKEWLKTFEIINFFFFIKAKCIDELCYLKDFKTIVDIWSIKENTKDREFKRLKLKNEFTDSIIFKFYERFKDTAKALVMPEIKKEESETNLHKKIRLD